MRAIIDTSSLLALVRYYRPFDKSNKLHSVLEGLYDSGELIILDKVAIESKYNAKGIILKELKFITEKPKLIVKTDTLLPNSKFFNRLENEFCNKNIRTSKDINDAEFENQKEAYLDNADAKIILYALSIAANSPIVVTEETGVENDGKLFKKIPSICSLIGTECCTIPELLKEHCGLKLSDLLY